MTTRTRTRFDVFYTFYAVWLYPELRYIALHVLRRVVEAILRDMVGGHDIGLFLPVDASFYDC